MKTVWLLCLAWLLGGSVVTAAVNPDVPQDKKTEKQLKKEQKAQKKAAEEAEQRLLFEAAKLAIEKQDFVLEADRVEFKRGQFAYVTSNTNFVSLKDGNSYEHQDFNGQEGKHQFLDDGTRHWHFSFGNHPADKGYEPMFGYCFAELQQ